MIAILSKLPFLKTALDFIGSKGRLVIEYILIALLITTAGLSFTLWLKNNRVEVQLANAETSLLRVQGRLSTVEHVNQEQELTITTLRVLRLKDATAIQGLITDYKELAGNDARVRRKLADLEAKDETIRTYLNQPIPADLACLLNNTCARVEGSNEVRKATPARSAASAVFPGRG